MRRLTGMLLAGALVVPAVLTAQGPPPRQRMNAGPGHHVATEHRGPVGGMFNPQMLINRRQRLELTDEQVKQLEALVTEVRQANEKAAADAKPREEKLREMWKVDQPNAQAIQTEMRALMAARQTAGLTAVAATAKAKGLLTAEQRGRVEGWADGWRMGGRQFDRGRSRMDGPRRGAGIHMQPRMRRF